jgi:hypothetical protein
MCADGLIIKKAIETIHSLPSKWENGKNTGSHQGGGTVTHDCSYGFEDKSV